MKKKRDDRLGELITQQCINQSGGFLCRYEDGKFFMLSRDKVIAIERNDQGETYFLSSFITSPILIPDRQVWDAIVWMNKT